MWVCLNDGFVSIVKKGGTDDDLLVRSRRKQDLVAFLDGRSYPIATGIGTDYKYRTLLPKRVVQEILVDRVQNIDYDNFKSSVKDDSLHNLYTRFWNLHYMYQR